MIVMNGVLFASSALVAWAYRPEWVRKLMKAGSEATPNGHHQAA